MSVLFTRVLVYAPDVPGARTGPTDVLVVGDRITVIGDAARSAAPASARVVDGGSTRLLLPGLINAHFHSSANHMKGSLPGLPLELFMLYESPEVADLRPTPREAYLRTMLGALEMLRSGVTSVQDDAFFVPYPEPEIIDAVMQAYLDAGLRATVAIDAPELPEIDKLPFLGRDAPEWLREQLSRPPAVGAEHLLDLYEHLFSTWHGAADGRLSAAVSVSAPQRVSPEYFAELDQLSRQHTTPLFAHVLETRVQRLLRDEQPRFAGRSLVKYTADLGLLSERMNVIHAVWTDDDDLDLIAASGATVAHNPISNLRLGSGIMPFRAMRDRGIPIALGSDEAITDDAIDLWAVAKTTGLIHTVTERDPADWPDADEVLDCLFRGGARAMLRADDLGAVEEGRLADLVLVDLETLAFTPLNDLQRQLVHCENGTSVRMTVVAGRVVAEGGVVTTVDEPALLAEARELFDARRPALEVARTGADALFPHYRAMTLEAASVAVTPDRRADR